jgi:hypothetical protein
VATSSRPRAATSRRDRATGFRREAEHLATLANRLERLDAPAGADEALRAYRDTLAAQISIDRRLARAIEVGDHSSEVVGTHQNEYNRHTRSRLAGRMGVGCLRDADPR